MAKSSKQSSYHMRTQTRRRTRKGADAMLKDSDPQPDRAGPFRRAPTLLSYPGGRPGWEWPSNSADSAAAFSPYAEPLTQLGSLRLLANAGGCGTDATCRVVPDLCARRSRDRGSIFFDFSTGLADDPGVGCAARRLCQGLQGPRRPDRERGARRGDGIGMERSSARYRWRSRWWCWQCCLRCYRP